MAKFKIGDRCKVVKNALAPKCIGQIVEITGIQSEKNGKVLYKIVEQIEGETFNGYASEGCLILAEEHRYKMIYDHNDEHPLFETDSLEAAIKTAIEDTEHYDYYIIEIYDSVENRIVWTTDKYFYEKEHHCHRLHSPGR